MVVDMVYSNMFEILITFENSKFRAESPLFPSCCGFGLTESEAVDSLINEISNFVAGDIKKRLKKELLTKDFEVVVSHLDEDGSFEHRCYVDFSMTVFNYLSSSSNFVSPAVSGGDLPSFSEGGGKDSKEEVGSFYNGIFSSLSSDKSIEGEPSDGFQTLSFILNMN